MSHKSGRRIWGLVCLGALLLGPLRASAQGERPDSKRIVESLYNDAAAEMEAGNFASACPKLETVTQMAPDGIGAKITLAECYEGWGKLATAWSTYVAAEERATKAGQTARAKKSAARAAALRPRLATLTVEVPAAIKTAAELRVFRDGTALLEGQLGTPLPIDRGSHEITVTARGRTPWKRTVEVPADGKDVPIEAQLGEPTAAPSPSGAASDAPPAVDSAAPRGSFWRIPVAAVGVALGAAGVGIGIDLRSRAIAHFEESNAGHCNAADLCDAEGVALRSDALAFGNGATAAIVAGAAFAAAGIVLIVTDIPGIRASLASVRIRTTASGLLLNGSF